MRRLSGLVIAALYLAVAAATAWVALGSPLAIADPGMQDIPYLALLGLHLGWGIVLLACSVRPGPIRAAAVRRRLLVTEMLGATTLLLFLFSFIFALNANMDYVRRFMESGGNLRLALDTREERLLVWARVFPLVAVNAVAYLLPRLVGYRRVVCAIGGRSLVRDPVVRPWALPLALASAFLSTVAMPSFLSLEGLPWLGWLALVPLFLAIRTARLAHGVFHLVAFGAFRTLLTNYWLATFHLVSLQITVLFFLVYYLLLAPPLLLVYRRVRGARFLVLPLAFTLFEYLHSIGFLGYPWALAAHSQYPVLPLIQVAEFGGVWAVSFLVLLGNSVLAETAGSLLDRAGGGCTRLHPQPVTTVRRSLIWLGIGAAVVCASMVYGATALMQRAAGPGDRVIRVAQIQQSNDPRKVEYTQTFETLVKLTDSTLASRPNLVVWSETAFVPNIRRWETDTSSYYYHRLVNRFLDYQAGLGTWLLTGNDDYELVPAADGTVERRHYNAAVLFTDQGTRDVTYHKVQLVPFTEYFPYGDALPWVHDLLMQFDVYLWEPGTEYTVFEHPLFRFSTPICYEDVFPNHVRGFVRAGAEAVLNLSNDYWSLTEVQAKQHFVAGLFRAVENRRPVLRTTASGLTGSIDPWGRILATVPQYEEQTLVSDLRIAERQPQTLYTRFGDLFPLAAAGGLLVLVVLSCFGRSQPRKAGPSRPARVGRGGKQPKPPRVDWRRTWDE